LRRRTFVVRHYSCHRQRNAHPSRLSPGDELVAGQPNETNALEDRMANAAGGMRP
jgi:hypothetical protein